MPYSPSSRGREFSEQVSPFALAFTVILAAFLRILYLGTKSYWWDEIVTIKISRLPFSQFCAWLWRFEANMALYYLLMRPWIGWNDTETWARLPSVLAAVACIPVIYAVGTRISSQWTGLVAALLLALNVTHIAYAQE